MLRVGFGMILVSQILRSDDSDDSEGAVLIVGTTDKPRWELGIGAGFFSGYDYPASNKSNQRAIAVPFFIYRSPALRLGDGGVRAVAIETPRLKLDLSIGGSLNANSEDNRIRQGMPDLDFLFEIGPQLEVRLVDKPLDTGGRLQARFTSELRAVFSTDLRSVDERGYVANIGIGINLRNPSRSNVTLASLLKVSYASEELQDYFYQVDQPFVTDDRPAFDAQGGYLDTSLFFGVATRPFPSVRVFAGVIQGFFAGAKNSDSPLYEVSEQTRLAFGIVWTIKQSKEMVEIVDLGSDG